MNAEEEARELQLILHKQNQDRFCSIEAELRDQRKILTRVDANTDGIPDRVRTLEDRKSRASGALWFMTFAIGGWEIFKGFFQKH